MWLPWGSSSPNPSSGSKPKPEEIAKVAPPSPSLNDWTGSLPSEPSDYPAYFAARLQSLPPEALLVTFAVGGASVVGTTAVYRRYFRRIPNSGWVTPNILKTKKRWVKGYVTKVGDADGFRLYHTPSIGWRWPFKFRFIPKPKDQRTAMKDQTLGIRIAGADAPEGANWGQPAQPFYDEAIAWFKGRVEGRFVYCQLHSKDQHGRIVASVHVPRRLLPGVFFKGPSVSIEMIRAGWAVVYEQSGAEYGAYSKEYYQKVEAEAISARRGLWVNGTNAEKPAEWKKRVRAAKSAKPAEAEEEEVKEIEQPEKSESTVRSTVRRWLGW
ncbi:nuclease [Peniophora sp. CONT]|nr:nuclease [Peniophora sp. CONT]